MNAEATADASLLDHDRPAQRVERNRFSRKWTSVPTSFARHADKGEASFREDDGDAHPHIAAFSDRFKCFDGAGGDALHLLSAHAQVARLFSRVDQRRAQCDPTVGAGGVQNLCRAGLDALRTADTAGKKTLFITRSGRPQIRRARRFGAAQSESACDGTG